MIRVKHFVLRVKLRREERVICPFAFFRGRLRVRCLLSSVSILFVFFFSRDFIFQGYSIL